MELSFDAKSFHTYTHTHRCEWAILNKECFQCFPSKNILFPELSRYWRTLCTNTLQSFVTKFRAFFFNAFWLLAMSGASKRPHGSRGCYLVKMVAGLKLLKSEVYLEKASNIHRWFFYVRRFSSIFSPYSNNSLLMQEAKRHAQMELSTLCLQWSWLRSTMAGGTEKRQTLRLTILIDSIWHAGILGFLMRFKCILFLFISCSASFLLFGKTYLKNLESSLQSGSQVVMSWIGNLLRWLDQNQGCRTERACCFWVGSTSSTGPRWSCLIFFETPRWYSQTGYVGFLMPWLQWWNGPCHPGAQLLRLDAWVRPWDPCVTLGRCVKVCKHV